MRKLLSIAIVSSMVLMVSCEKESFNEQEPISSNSKLRIVPNQLLVKFKSGIESRNKSNALLAINGIVEEEIITNAMKTEMQRNGSSGELVLVTSKLETFEAIAILKNFQEIEYAEPNYIYSHNATSNDPSYVNGSLWGMYGSTTTPSNQYGSRAATAWAAGNVGSSNVYVGIIDEGYMYEHDDLAANAGKNPGEIPNNGIDDDNNGYVDDVYGWDFDGDDNSIFDGLNDDHGTHVAGTIGGVGGNNLGVAGVCWNVKMLGGKFLGRRGGTTANAIRAVDYFTDLKQRHGLNIVATNNSWGGGGYSQALYDAIERANQAGILFIAAAGNESNNNDSNLSYPGSYNNSNIITVASITSNGGLSSFSNFGATTVDIGAPGSSIYSTVPSRSKGNIGSSYATYSGTSMATPHVTGAAALYAASHAGASAAAIKTAIVSNAIPTSSLNGKCTTAARLNVSNF